jgi:hypothetical protein
MVLIKSINLNYPYTHYTIKIKKSYMPLFYPFKSTYQSLLPYTFSQYFSLFGINLQKGSPHQKKEIMVDT